MNLRFIRKGFLEACCVLLCQFSMPVASDAQEIWFGSQAPHFSTHRGLVGPVDWEQLFESGSHWSTVAAHVSVFTINSQHLKNSSDAELSVIVRELNRQKIALGVEMLAQTETADCGRGVEGYGSPADVKLIAEKLKRVGGTLRYVTMDEPLQFGHYYSGPNACHSSIEDVARRVSINIAEYEKVFPDIVVGDIEPLASLTSQANWESDYSAWKAAFETAVGKPLAFLQLDINWERPEWPNSLKAAAALVHSLGMKVGIIYNATPSDVGDNEWFNRAKSNFTQVESELLIPDQAFFSTWDDYPTHVLPEEGTTTHTHLIFEYLLSRTRIILSQAGGAFRGQLLDDNGHPIPGERVSVETLGITSSKSPPSRKMTGIVPERARFAIVGLRMNTECGCSGPNDIRVGEFNYTEEQGNRVPRRGYFSLRARAAMSGNDMIETQLGSPVIHVVARQGQTVLLNTNRFMVTPKAHFEFSIALASASNTHFSGYATVIFTDEKGQEVLRVKSKYDDDYVPFESRLTDGNGVFSYDPPLDQDGRPVRLRFIFAGSATLRGAFANQ